MWVTEEEKQRAKQYDVLIYLRNANPGDLIKTARGEYCTKTHDSLKISNGLWYWYSREIGGRTAVDYLIKVKGYSFPGAVREVNRALAAASPPFLIPPKKKKPFALPEKNDNNDRVIKYLTLRGIEEGLIQSLIEQGFIFESRQHNSVVFVGFDEEGEPRYASYRSTGKKDAKGDFAGSDKRYSFRIENKQSDIVHVFEGAIDLLSYMTICKLRNKECIRHSFISLSGIYASKHSAKYKLPPVLDFFLERNKQIKVVCLHLDSDTAGINAAKGIEKALKLKYEVYNIPPDEGKDYNDYLRIVKEKEGQ